MSKNTRHCSLTQTDHSPTPCGFQHAPRTIRQLRPMSAQPGQLQSNNTRSCRQANQRSRIGPDCIPAQKDLPTDKNTSPIAPANPNASPHFCQPTFHLEPQPTCDIVSKYPSSRRDPRSNPLVPTDLGNMSLLTMTSAYRPIKIGKLGSGCTQVNSLRTGIWIPCTRRRKATLPAGPAGCCQLLPRQILLRRVSARTFGPHQLLLSFL